MSKFKPDENKNTFESMNLGDNSQNPIPSTLEGSFSGKEDKIKNSDVVEEKDAEEKEEKSKGVFVDKREINSGDSINMGVTNQNQIPSSIEKPGNK